LRSNREPARWIGIRRGAITAVLTIAHYRSRHVIFNSLEYEIIKIPEENLVRGHESQTIHTFSAGSANQGWFDAYRNFSDPS
jgi:hypothetical protein